MRAPVWGAAFLVAALFGAEPKLLTLSAPNAAEPLATPVPYTGTEMVHPSVVYQKGGWNHFPYWMAVTPYAHSDGQYENPSLYCSKDGITWIPAQSNPLVPKPALARRYNSDCHLALDADGSLHLVYRTAGADQNDQLWLMSSKDGRTWSKPKVILDVDLADERQLSPALVFADKLWNLYYVDASSYPYQIRRRTAQRPQGPWSAAQEVTGIAPPPERMLWHLDAFRSQGNTVLLVNTTAIYHTQDGGQLFLATTQDGLAFTRGAKPVLSGSDGWDRSLYRSCALPVGEEGAGVLEIWYSAWGPELGWRIGHTFAGR